LYDLGIRQQYALTRSKGPSYRSDGIDR